MDQKNKVREMLFAQDPVLKALAKKQEDDMLKAFSQRHRGDKGFPGYTPVNKKPAHTIMWDWLHLVSLR